MRMMSFCLTRGREKGSRKLKKKSKPQPAGSSAHKAEAAVDEDGFLE